MTTIVPAHLDDAPALLAMQRVAFEPEARACDDWAIPPLQETLDGVREHIRAATVLKAVEGDRLLGAIRGIVSGGTCLIRVLVVAEAARGRGLGARLLRAIEDAHPQVERFELTTNMIMVGNVRFYLRHGYEVVEQIQHAPTIRLAFMRKIARR
ncbi:GNAT family N-acetyltransferase [Scleromatobacter humisilvae]|uniref:GNAT family N-acetyltransferase n=1 Tax=Scleromatobacter humisilvae TaxID=2897159 RepID=A0A9X2C2Q0_9BURK|nr:GNAT family N-acetyltransferase [Scleromatobacter humisilvae]MCK9686300.1 GNAT family N-acetyltransferase [Scleromatobacter humisilvae]